jgi:hypothetical protein
VSPIGTLSNSRGFLPNVHRLLVLSEPNENGVAKQSVSRPSQIRDLGDKLRLDPVDAGKNERRAEARAPRQWDAQGRLCAV